VEKLVKLGILLILCVIIFSIVSVQAGDLPSQYDNWGLTPTSYILKAIFNATTNAISVSQSSIGNQSIIISQYLGIDGADSTNVIGNYASAPDTFYIAPSAGEVYRISRLIVHLEDTVGIDADAYGNAITLTNGIQVKQIEDNGGGSTVLITDFTSGIPVKTNGDWAAMCYDAALLTWGSGNEHFVVRWTFSKSGQYVRLDGDQNDQLIVIVNDDLTGLVNHNFLVQGYKEGTVQ
jgi:hypothetical protein